MLLLRLVPSKTAIRFIRLRRATFAVSGLLVLLSAILLITPGLNVGIDFQGGILIEVKTPGPANLALMRSSLGGLGLGEVALQEFGTEDDVLIRVEKQPGDSTAQQAAVDRVKQALTRDVGPGIDYRRVEFVGPKVSAELYWAGFIAVVSAVVLMLIYIWFRFEWQFSIGAVLALIHDVVLTLGMFSLTGIEFNLASIAAILTIVGYSINDTVVVYDRVRENLRRYKVMGLGQLLDLSVNHTLSRTTMTSVTTLLALLALFFFGGAVIRGFTAAMIWGVIIGTYSSIFIAAPVLMYLGVRSEPSDAGSEVAKAGQGGG